MSAVRTRPEGPSIANACVTVPRLRTVIAIVPVLATVGIDGVIRNSRSLSDRCDDDGLGAWVGAEEVLGGAELEVAVEAELDEELDDALAVPELLEEPELDEPEDPQPAITAAARTARTGMERLIWVPSEKSWSLPRPAWPSIVPHGSIRCNRDRW
jgi:hypothetical protein